jgi:hypothetical protein
MRALGVLVLLTGWVLLTDSRALQTFGSETACRAEIVAWAGRAREGARWVAAQRDQAKAQPNESIELFWRQAVRRAAEQEAWVRGARCLERRS